jgi:nucleotide-binding universal stress UspA family protein
MTAPATPRIRHGAGRRGGIVVHACAVPRWVERWCDRSGRPVVARAADAIAIASAAGDSVLVPRVEPPSASSPRVVAALRGLPDDASVLVDAIDAAVHLDGRLVVLHGVPLSFGERSVGRDEALDRGRDLLEEARALVDGAGTGVPVEVGLVRAWPHELVGELLDADLLVLGGPRADDTGRLGLVAASALRHAPCSVLLAPRPTFPTAAPGPAGSARRRDRR